MLIAFVCGLLVAWAMPFLFDSSAAPGLGKGRERQRTDSPDGAYSAFLCIPTLDGLGATISQPYQLWLEKRGVDGTRQLAFVADNTDGFQLSWRTPTVLLVCYERASIYQFRNRIVTIRRGQDVPGIFEAEVVLHKARATDECR